MLCIIGEGSMGQIMRFLLRRILRYSRTDQQIDFQCGFALLFPVLVLRVSFISLHYLISLTSLCSFIQRTSLVSLLSLLSLSCRFSLSLGLFWKLKQSFVMKSTEVSIQLSKDSAFCCLCRPVLDRTICSNFYRQFCSTFYMPTFSLAINTSISLKYISPSSSIVYFSIGLTQGRCCTLLTAIESNLPKDAVLCQSMIDTADFLIFLPKVLFWKGSAGSVESAVGSERCQLSNLAKFCSMMSISFIRNQLIYLIYTIFPYIISMQTQPQGQTWEWSWKIIVTALVAVPLLKFLWLLGATIVKQITPMPDLLGKYCSKNKRSWAVVTGATDGIGLGFCEVLTQLGFNVVLISRNAEKLQKTKESLLAYRPAHFASSEFKSIVFDFKDSSDPVKWEGLMSQLRQLDIALLVNNVGTSDMKYFENYSFDFINDIININCISMAALSAEVANMMRNRDRRSAMINLSSFLGEKSMPFVTLYSATKAFNRELSNSLALECPFIDVMCLKPMFVESPLSRQKKGFGIPDRRECAWDSLKELRWTSETYGYYSHRIMGFLARTFVPDWLYRMSVGMSAKTMFRKLFPEAKMD